MRKGRAKAPDCMSDVMPPLSRFAITPSQESSVPDTGHNNLLDNPDVWAEIAKFIILTSAVGCGATAAAPHPTAEVRLNLAAKIGGNILFSGGAFCRKRIIGQCECPPDAPARAEYS